MKQWHPLMRRLSWADRRLMLETILLTALVRLALVTLPFRWRGISSTLSWCCEERTSNVGARMVTLWSTNSDWRERDHDLYRDLLLW